MTGGILIESIKLYMLLCGWYSTCNCHMDDHVERLALHCSPTELADVLADLKAEYLELWRARYAVLGNMS